MLGYEKSAEKLRQRIKPPKTQSQPRVWPLMYEEKGFFMFQLCTLSTLFTCTFLIRKYAKKQQTPDNNCPHCFVMLTLPDMFDSFVRNQDLFYHSLKACSSSFNFLEDLLHLIFNKYSVFTYAALRWLDNVCVMTDLSSWALEHWLNWAQYTNRLLFCFVSEVEERLGFTIYMDSETASMKDFYDKLWNIRIMTKYNMHVCLSLWSLDKFILF